MNPGLELIVATLNKRKTRATYGAVGEALDLPARTIGGMLGERRPEVSWIVNSDTGLPSGYSQQEMHPDLAQNPEIISGGLALLQLVVGITPRPKEM